MVSIVMIGLLTAFIGDLASHFGCTIGLKDSVTAVVFVALGTSVPGERKREVGDRKKACVPQIFVFRPHVYIYIQTFITE